GTNGAVGTIATSTLNIALGDTTGTLAVSRGGTGITTTPSYGQLLLGTGSGYALTATSSLGITSSQWTTNASDIYYTTGNVGIGTTSPYARLAVAGQVVASYFTATSTTASSTIAAPLMIGTPRNTDNQNLAIRNWTGVAGDTNYGAFSVGFKNNLHSNTFEAAVVGNDNTVDTLVGGVFGFGNQLLEAEDSYIFGHNNIGRGSKHTIVGTNNTVTGSGDSAGIYGAENTIDGDGIQFAFGKGLSLTENQTFAIGQLMTNSLAESLDLGVGNSSKVTITTTDVRVRTPIVSTASASSTFTNGIDISAGCFAVNGTCITNSVYDDTSVSAFIHASTTIPKTYTANTFSALQTLTGGLTTNALTLGSLNGPLQSNNGVVSATTSIGVLYGGTGLTAAPSYGQLLLGNSSGGYTLTATSSLGITSSQWTTNASDIYYTTGNVGIGTTSPYAKLSVAGDTIFNGNLLVTATTTSSGFALAEGKTFYVGNDVLIDSDGNLNAVVLPLQDTAANLASVVPLSGELIYETDTTYTKIGDGVTSVGSLKPIANIYYTLAGNVGVGTTSPAAEFAVGGRVLSDYFTAASSTATTTLRGNVSIGGPRTYASNNSIAVGKSTNVDTITASGQGSSAFGYVSSIFNSSAITSSGFGSFVAGSVASSPGGFMTASGVGSIALGSAAETHTLLSSGSGSIALGYAVSGKITASGQGAFAGGRAGTGGITSSGQGSFFFGSAGTSSANLATGFGKGFENDIANSFMVGYSSLPTLTVNSSSLGIGTTTPGTMLAIGSSTDYVNISPYATSTFSKGINLLDGCFAVNGTCITNSVYDDTSVSAFIHASTTIPKVYTANTFSALQTFTGGLTTNALTLGSLNGPLQANNGVISATSSIGVLYGGTGLTAAPSYGQLLVGNGTGYTLTATSSLGLMSSSAIGAGTTGQIPYYAANGTTLTATSSLFIAANGNIGIGTTSPYAKLSVVGETVAEYFTATSTTATSTFAGDISFNNAYGIVLPLQDTSSNLAAVVPLSGQRIYVTDTNDTKVGDGVTMVSDLPQVNTQWIDNSLDGIYFNQGAVSIGSTATSTAPFFFEPAVGRFAATVKNFNITGDQPDSIFSGNSAYFSWLTQDAAQLTLTDSVSLLDADGNGLSTDVVNVNVTSGTGNVLLNAGNDVTITPANILEINAAGTTTSTTGFDISSGCYAINGVCVGGSGSGTVGSGTTGQIPYYAANGTTLTATSSLFMANTGNIGIGTTSPYANLSVAGNVVADIFMATSSGTASTPVITTSNDTNTGFRNVADGFWRFSSNGTDFASWGGTQFALSSTGRLSWASGAIGTTIDTELYRGAADQIRTADSLIVDGNIGIGTTSPVSKLSVAGSTYLGGVVTATGTISVYDSTGSTLAASVSNAGVGSFLSGAGTGAIRFGANVNAAGTLSNSTRKVGRIVVPSYSNPNNNIAIFSADFTSATQNNIFFGNIPGGSAYGAQNMFFSTTPSDSLTGAAASTSIAIVHNVGVGIGNGYVASFSGAAVNPSAALSVLDFPGSVKNIFQVSSSTGSGAAPTAVPVLTIPYTGNVGIGTTSPWRMLSVNGSSDLGTNALAGTFTATTSSATSTFNNINMLSKGSSPGGNSTIDFGGNYGLPALLLYNPGSATNRWGWGLNAGEMQFFSTNGVANRFTWNAGGDLQSTGSNELMRLRQGTSGGTPQLGIGETSPEGTLHVKNGSAGSVTANTNSNTIVMEASGNSGFSLLTPDANFGTIYFGSPSDNLGAQLSWSHNDQNLYISTQNANDDILFRTGDAAAMAKFHDNGSFSLGASYYTTAGPSNGAIIQGNVGIGTTSPWKTFSVVGTAAFNGLTAASVSGDALCLSANNEMVVNTGAQTCTVSSARFKNSIGPLSIGLEALKTLNPVSFKYNGSDDQRIGFIAEEVGQVDDRLIFTEADGTTPRGVRYEDMVAVVVNAVKEQQVQIGDIASSTIGLENWKVDAVTNLASSKQTLQSLASAIDASNLAIATIDQKVSALASTTEELALRDVEIDISEVSMTISSDESFIDAIVSSTSARIASTTIDIIASTTEERLATSTPFITTIASAVTDMIRSIGEWTMDKLTARIVYADRVETQVAAISNGLEMTDAATGQVYCVRISGGDWLKDLGACGEVQSPVPASPAAPVTPESDPEVVPEESPTTTDSTATSTPQQEIVEDTASTEDTTATTEESAPADDSTTTPVVDEGDEIQVSEGTDTQSGDTTTPSEAEDSTTEETVEAVEPATTDSPEADTSTTDVQP
ncbi:MAG: tail fiber domain-containing protein, partial [Candidatus Pacebacteria bacterium]|nr:tail fiber domain-containing protein [Candidatus Paceibacterota bacterium]